MTETASPGPPVTGTASPRPGEYFFRVRDNGALVFKVETENRQRRLELDQIATANLRNGEIKPQGSRTLTEADLTAIRDWIAQRKALMARREMDDMLRSIDQLNHAAQWVQAKASDAEFDAFADQMLMAMHDLRSAIVRRRADGAAKKAQPRK